MKISPCCWLFFLLMMLLAPGASGQSIREDSLLHTIGKKLPDSAIEGVLPLHLIKHSAIPGDFAGQTITHLAKHLPGNQTLFGGRINAIAWNIDSVQVVQQLFVLLDYSDTVLHNMEKYLGKWKEVLHIGSAFPESVPDGKMYKWEYENLHVSGLIWQRAFHPHFERESEASSPFTFLLSIISSQRMQQIKKQHTGGRE